jgi:hypothetical protein
MDQHTSLRLGHLGLPPQYLGHRGEEAHSTNRHIVRILRPTQLCLRPVDDLEMRKFVFSESPINERQRENLPRRIGLGICPWTSFLLLLVLPFAQDSENRLF